MLQSKNIWQLCRFWNTQQLPHFGNSPVSCKACSLLSPALLPSTTLDTDTGHKVRTGKLRRGSSLLLIAPFLQGREGMMCILQLTNADDALSPQDILSSSHCQSNLSSLAPAFCVVPSCPGENDNLGTGWTVALAEHSWLVSCGSTPHKRNFIRKPPSLDGEIVSNWKFIATPGKLFQTVEKTRCLPC